MSGASDARGARTVVQAVASGPGRGAARSPRAPGQRGGSSAEWAGPGAGAAALHADGLLQGKKKEEKGKKGGPRRGLLRLVNLFPRPFNPPPGRLSFQDSRGCKPFEVHQHGEVLLYFRSPRFIPGRGSGRPGGLLRSLGLPRRTRGHSDTRLRGEGGRELGPTGRGRSSRPPSDGARTQRRDGLQVSAPAARAGACACAPVRPRAPGGVEVAAEGFGGAWRRRARAEGQEDGSKVVLCVCICVLGLPVSFVNSE